LLHDYTKYGSIFNNGKFWWWSIQFYLWVGVLMKSIYLAIFLLILTIAFPVYAEPYNPCKDNVCVVSFDFGNWFGFGQGGSGGTPADTYNLLLEIADTIILEGGDNIILEAAP
jgi:hypothetical protein